MAYRVKCAETEEEKEKERRFMGMGLTSRKNLCINPDVCKPILVHGSPTLSHGRLQKRRKERSLMQDVATSPTASCARRTELTPVQSKFVTGTKYIILYFTLETYLNHSRTLESSSQVHSSPLRSGHLKTSLNMDGSKASALTLQFGEWYVSRTIRYQHRFYFSL